MNERFSGLSESALGPRNKTLETTYEESVNLEQVEEARSRLGETFYEQVDNLRREAEELNLSEDSELNSILEKFRKLGSREIRSLALAAAVLMPTSALGEGGPNLDQNSTQEDAMNIEATTTVEAGLADLESRVMVDDYETMHSYFGRKFSMEKVASITGADGVGVVGAAPTEMADAQSMAEEIFDKEATPIKNFLGKITGNQFTSTVMHNHPVKLLQEHYNLSDEHLAMISRGELPTIIAPPSMVDIEGMFSTAAGIDRVDYVVGPGGTWKCDPDEANPYMQITRRHLRDLSVEMEKIMSKASLSDVMGMVERDINDTPIQDILTELDENPNRNELSTALTELANQRAEMLETELGPDYLQAMEDLQKTAEKIGQASVDGTETESLIAEYIRIGRSLGIEVTYTPK